MKTKQCTASARSLDGPYAMAFQTASMFVCLSRVCLWARHVFQRKFFHVIFFLGSAKQSRAEQGKAELLRCNFLPEMQLPQKPLPPPFFTFFRWTVLTIVHILSVGPIVHIVPIVPIVHILRVVHNDIQRRCPLHKGIC
jgi:hypothetical protein